MLLDLIELKNKHNMNITGIIHIGAHFGEEHETYKTLGVTDVIYFEPVKKTFNVLKERIKDTKIFNYALGNENKLIEMHIEEADAYGCSSILQPSSNYDGVKFSQKEIVEMKRLDEFNFTGYNFLNVDVQGYEYEVFKGSSETLKHVDYILCEVNRIIPEKKMDYIGATTVEEITNFLSQYNFQLVEVDWSGMSWGDALFIKQK